MTFSFPPYHSLCYMLLLMSSGHSPGDFCTGFCSCGDLFSETDNELSMQHAYPVHQEISDEILLMHYGRTFTRERKKSVKPAQLSSIRDLTQLNVNIIHAKLLFSDRHILPIMRRPLNKFMLNLKHMLMQCFSFQTVKSLQLCDGSCKVVSSRRNENTRGWPISH